LFFEGSEKKAEIIVNRNSLSLLNDISDSFWQGLVNCSNARILSQISNNDCKAFLLSESSLFVWHDRFLILTCGVTQLVNSVEYFMRSIYSQQVIHVTYQRKNEYFAHAQPSCFGDDIQLLSQYISGKAYRFGEMDSHHNYIFHQDNATQTCPQYKTYELLAYQISETASKTLTTPGLSAQTIREFFAIEQLLPDFIIDDFVFQPYGYSLNAICQDKYLTIHVTPQAASSYVSFESNLNLITLAPKILANLAPTSFDLLGFNEFDFKNKVQANIGKHYISKTLVEKTLSNGYFVCFANFIKPQLSYSQATPLEISEENHAL
jgi:S-adenosylmethionine decarboxylase